MGLGRVRPLAREARPRSPYIFVYKMYIVHTLFDRTMCVQFSNCICWYSVFARSRSKTDGSFKGELIRATASDSSLMWMTLVAVVRLPSASSLQDGCEDFPYDSAMIRKEILQGKDLFRREQPNLLAFVPTRIEWGKVCEIGAEDREDVISSILGVEDFQGTLQQKHPDFLHNLSNSALLSCLRGVSSTAWEFPINRCGLRGVPNQRNPLGRD